MITANIPTIRQSRIVREWITEVESNWLELLTHNYPELTLDDISDDDIELTSEQQTTYNLMLKYPTYEAWAAAGKPNC